MTEEKKGFNPWFITAGIFGIVILLILLTALMATEEELENKVIPPSVETITLKPSVYDEKIILPAKILAKKEYAIISETNDQVGEWLVKEGESVVKGTPLVQMRRDTLEDRLTQARAGLESAVAGVEVTESRVRLAELSLEQARRAKETAELNFEAAKTAASAAASDHIRSKNLLEKGSVNQAAYDQNKTAWMRAKAAEKAAENALRDAQAGIESAETNLSLVKSTLKLDRANLNSAKAEVNSLEIALEKSTVKAPADGILDKHLVQAGEFAPAGTRLGMLYDLSSMRAVVNIADRQVAFLDNDNKLLSEYVKRIAPGSEQQLSARVFISGPPRLQGGFHNGLEIPAKITRIGAAASPMSNTFEVELGFPNPGKALRHGILGEAEITFLRYPEAIVIPVNAVVVTDEGPKVMILKSSGEGKVAESRMIQAGSLSDNSLFVPEGLKPGEELVVAGTKGLAHGEEVRVIRSDGKLIPVEREQESDLSGEKDEEDE